MFDLFRSRAKAVRYLLGALLLLVALSMVVTLIPGYGSAGRGGGENDQVVAEIGKEVISVRDVQLGVKASLKARQIPDELISAYVPQIVNQLISEKAVEYLAQQMGFKITDQELVQAIQTMVPNLFPDGKFIGKDMYAQMLAQQDLTIPDFERSVRRQAIMMRLQNLVLEGMVVTPQEVEAEYRAKNEQVALEYVALSRDKLRSQVQVKPEELQTLFNQQRDLYQLPERRTFMILSMDEDKMNEVVKFEDADLLQLYNQNKDRYRVPERVKVRHILIKTADKPKEEQAKLKAKAEDLLKKIRAGADFAELAKQNSDDPGSAAKGGELDWITRGQTVKNFEDAAFTLKPKQISDLVSTEYGFHIIQVLEKEQARLKPFEEVKAQLSTDVKRQAIYDRMPTLMDEARAKIAKNPGQAEQIARDMKLNAVVAENKERGAKLPIVGESVDFSDAVFSLKPGEVTPVVQVNDKVLAFAVLTGVQPARKAEFSEVQDKVREKIVDDKANQMLADKARTVLERAKAGEDFKKLAQSVGGEYKKTALFNRNGAAEGLGAAGLVSEAFRSGVNFIFGPVQNNNQSFICKVVEKKPADMSQFAQQRYNILLDLKSRKARERNDVFADGVLTQLIKKGKVKIHQDVVKRLSANYRAG